jgi:hypothetical protein
MSVHIGETPFPPRRQPLSRAEQKEAALAALRRDKKGVYADISKHQLQVDHRYQRSIYPSRVNYLIAKWSWVGCGTLTVALRPDLVWVVMAGQHRLAAAMRMDGVDLLPCLVFELDSITEEALGFLASSDAHAVTTVDKFKAMVLSGDPQALVVQDMVSSIGRIVSGGASANTLACIGQLLSCVRTDEAAIRRIWPMLGELCSGQVISGEIIKALFFLETHQPPGVSLSQPHWHKKIVGVGLSKLVTRMQASATHYGNRHARALSEGCGLLLNHGARTHKLHIVGATEAASE